MYQRILVTLDASSCDRTIIDHIKKLAKFCGASVVLLHVADGWAARRFGKDAVSAEITHDSQYLQKVKAEFEAEGIPATAELSYGEPRDQIIKWIEEKTCDLLAMSTHGHRFWGELLFGTTAIHVQHRVTIPVLLLRKRRENC